MTPVPVPPPAEPAPAPPSDLIIDLQRRSATLGGVPLQLGGRAFDLLATMASRPGRVFTAAELMAAVWPGRVVDETNLRAQIRKLRQQIGSHRVANVSGRGYTYCATNRSATATHHPAAAPRPSTELLGRDDDLVALAQRVAGHRLVTLLGTGGVGKTQLALSLARSLQKQRPEPVWWVDLAVPGQREQPSLAQTPSLALALAQALGLQLGRLEGSNAGRELGTALAGHEGLLVLDNAESAAQALAELLQDLLPLAPLLSVLVTSQQRLQLPTEQVYRLAPLQPPAALQLLMRRARAIDQHYALQAHEMDDAAHLCERLDRLPLALEMAGTQLPALGLQTLQRHLDDRLRLLDQPLAGTPARQRTLQAALAWSHSLLEPAAQAVLRRLAVFAAPFRLPAAQQVAADDGLDGVAVVRAVTTLVDRSLLQFQPPQAQADAPRWRLLETPRLFAAQQLDHHDERAATQQRHARAMAALAAQARAEYWVSGDAEWLTRWHTDHDEFVLGFDHACAAGDAESAALIGEALSAAANLTGQFQQLHARTEQALALLPQAGPLARAYLWNRTVVTMATSGLRKLEASQRRLQAWRLVGEPMNLSRAMVAHIADLERAGHGAEADALMAELKALEQPHWPPRQRALGVALAELYLGSQRNDIALLRRAMLSWQTLARQGGLARLALQALGNLASVDILQGQPEQAVPKLLQTATEMRALGNAVDAALVLNRLAKVELGLGNVTQGRDWLEQALLTSQDASLLARYAESGAALALAMEQAERAARLLATASAHDQVSSLGSSVWEREALQRLQQTLQQRLDSDTLTRCRIEGENLSVPAVYADLLAWLRGVR